MYQHRHYESIADLLAGYMDSSSDNGNKLTVPHFLNLLDTFVSMFKNDNPNFNEERFRKAVYDRSTWLSDHKIAEVLYFFK